MIRELDLHGVKHEDVEKLVEEAILISSETLRIITGNSVEMRKIVFQTLLKNKAKSITLAKNLGEIIAYP